MSDNIYNRQHGHLYLLLFLTSVIFFGGPI